MNLLTLHLPAYDRLSSVGFLCFFGFFFFLTHLLALEDLALGAGLGHDVPGIRRGWLVAGAGTEGGADEAGWQSSPAQGGAWAKLKPPPMRAL